MLGLIIKTEPCLGATPEEWAIDALELATELNCAIEVTSNWGSVIIYPGDASEEIVTRYKSMARKPESAEQCSS